MIASRLPRLKIQTNDIAARISGAIGGEMRLDIYMKSRMYFLLANLMRKMHYFSKLASIRFEYYYKICMVRGIFSSDTTLEQKKVLADILNS